MQNTSIATGFPFESKYVEVEGAKVHYVDEGQGKPILFLHGNPTSSYLWRNIMPHLANQGRCIAVDLIGMGKSDKPDLDYRFQDHYRYVEGFIEALGLKDITLVLHDWGSGLGFHYARRHPDNVRGIAFMEAIIRPMRWQDFPGKFRIAFRMFRTPGLGHLLLSNLNMFVTQILPQAVVRSLGKEERRRYAEPFPTVGSRKPVRVWPLEIPIEGKPADMYDIVSSYSNWLQETQLPKILFYAQPGGILREDDVEWCRENLPNLETVDIGPGIHFVQEDNPERIGERLAEWYRKLK